jgi:hypothetical protein
MSNVKKRLSRMQRLACLGITVSMHISPTGAMEALTGFPPLETVIQLEALSAAYCLWILGCWSYRHPTQGHRSILMQLERFDPIFNMGFDVMRTVFNIEHKYRVTMLTREEKTRESGTPPVVKGLSSLQMGPE